MSAFWNQRASDPFIASQEVVVMLFAPLEANDAPDPRGLLQRERHRGRGALPQLAFTSEELLRLEDVVGAEPELGQGNLQLDLLGGVRIHVHRHQDLVEPVFGSLAVEKDAVVGGRIEAKVPVFAPRGILSPDSIHQRDEGAKVSRRVWAPIPELVLVRIEILLAARSERLVLAQLVAGEDSVRG